MDDFNIEATFDDSHILKCPACGRNFAKSNAYSIHVGSCQPQKKRMAGALELAKETYRKKKARLNNATLHQPHTLHQPQLLAQFEHGPESQAVEPIIDSEVSVPHNYMPSFL